MTPCRHCQIANATRPRGLCYVCYGDPAVRGRYAKRAPCASCGRCLPDNPAQRVGLVCARCRSGGAGLPPGLREKLDQADRLLRSRRVRLGPTDAEPGSALKVAVLCFRRARTRPLFHLGDRTTCPPPGAVD